jgi:hypothetical protein
MTTKFFHPSLLLLFLDPGSGMGKNQDPGSGINIPDPPHWIQVQKGTGSGSATLRPTLLKCLNRQSHKNKD